MVKVTAKKRLPCRIECRSRQAEDYLNRLRGAKEGKKQGGGMTVEEEERARNEVVFIRRAFGEPVAATRNIPLRVRGRNVCRMPLIFFGPSVGIRGARRKRN